jgi:hypothetical protein
MSDRLLVAGKCHMLAFPKGLLSELMSYGVSLQDAKTMLQHRAVDERWAKNLVVDLGLGFICDHLIENESGTGLDPAGLTYHAIGTGVIAPAAGDAVLGFEVRRKIFTNRSRSSNVLELDVFYLANESTFFIKECGIFGGSFATAVHDTGTMFSHFLLSYDNTAGVNDLTFSYYCTIGTL